MKKEVIIYFLVVVIIIPFVSAGLFDFFKDVFQSPSQPTDVTVQVGNLPPEIFYVQKIGPINPLAGTTVDIIFDFMARDPNGVNDLDDLSVKAWVNYSTEPLRFGSCILKTTTSIDKTYQCTISMQYYDIDGMWNINVSLHDKSGTPVENTTQTFVYSLLKDIIISPLSVSFPIVAPGGINILSSSNTLVTNNGNFDTLKDNLLFISSFNLTGLVNPLEYIPASSFYLSGISLSGSTCSLGTELNASRVMDISSISLGRGLPPINQDQIIYCLTNVPSILSSQSYSTTGIGSGQWVIQI